MSSHLEEPISSPDSRSPEPNRPLSAHSSTSNASNASNALNSVSEFELDFDETLAEAGKSAQAPLKADLEKATAEAQAELSKQLLTRSQLQTQILSLLESAPMELKQNAYLMANNISDIKYNNSLAVIHQIRKEFRVISQKYKATKQELNKRLQEKQEGAKEVREHFESLKAEVVNNSAEGKRGVLKTLEELGEQERQVNAEMQELRLEIIKMRMDLDGKTKMLSNKDELSEGLHLIDFEKLKIENQSLNEKIEERNEELVKLQKKNNASIHVLAHIREKLTFDKKSVAELLSKHKEVEERLRTNNMDICKHENDLKNLKVKSVKLTQETGIVMNRFLKKDFIRRTSNLIQLEKQRAELEETLAGMSKTINRYTLLRKTLSSAEPKGKSPPKMKAAEKPLTLSI